MKVKICGIQTKEEALLIAKEKPDFIGMVFAPSKRKIDLDQAANITEALKGKNIKTVGVLVNPTIKDCEAVISAGVDYLQFHGDEDQSLIEKYKDRAIKAFPSNSKISYKDKFTYPGQYILIDSPREKFYGGSGVTFNWSELPLADIDEKRFGLAGGLNPNNIETVLENFRPALIDVSSGVETDGYKDIDKVRAFIQKIRGVKNDK
ncbi:phosphoribosylanthranilate isomerase [Jeotgalicoccus meleagridis]|uniref:N-(5'-phosphoribosyl)anthranilate isomerase n=1 Tax=Jeotgalicoccus meleagridis TaxID=2759181 RepID=A0A6V7RNE1_9STAP|nr:phosphoribosylanthranilate isomerase [Jeotgalicoccus meleagridis]CAD2079983.1 N-(5'-phosphoribosyl)anthranilate isomerase [Jeotgalicoccus meleagridis]